MERAIVLGEKVYRRKTVKMWMEMLEDNMRRCALSPVEAKERCLWRGRIHGAKWPTWVNLDIP
jgi:hypothetical protein